MQQVMRLPRYLGSRPLLLRRTINTAIGAGAAGGVIVLAGLGESSLAASEYKVMQHRRMAYAQSQQATHAVVPFMNLPFLFTSNALLPFIASTLLSQWTEPLK